MPYALEETTCPRLTDLIQDALETGALLQRRSDDAPFLEAVGGIFEGDPNFHVFAVADSGDRPLGFTMTLPGQSDGVLVIGPTFITERCRGRGLGKYMLQRLIDRARDWHVSRLVFETWGRNAAARRLVESLGFRFAAEELNARVNGDSTVAYVLDLNLGD
jgi:GNAT superfamily N-acetyltransferase